MLTDPSQKYRPFDPGFDMSERRWPSRSILRAPRWLSTDLRDGNQALIAPMDVEKKLMFFNMLVKIGLKEIEVGFPSASQTEFDFVRKLIEADHIPEDVTIQVLTPARQDLIERTFEALKGFRSAIVHLYNATSPLFRRVVFGLDKAEVMALSTKGAQLLCAQAAQQPDTLWGFEYSPETFTATEPEFALEVCEAVIKVVEPTPQNPLILNLPATVEVAGPHIYADQIEWFCRHISKRDSVVISLHPHNDRGTGIAAAELGLLAGADRIEGCLFGNGERTGNVDLVTLALNLYSQGIAPNIDFSNLSEVVSLVEHCNQIKVHPRHPYAGELVFTAFSGSHQDAIKKGFAAQAQRNDALWEVPYLAIDPADLGQSYEAVIRVNSQSGKGGIAWVLEQNFGLKLPRRLQIDFSRQVQDITDLSARELGAEDIGEAFFSAYQRQGVSAFQLIEYEQTGPLRSGQERLFSGRIMKDGIEASVTGRGNGLISSAVTAFNAHYGLGLEVVDYSEHALKTGTGSQAVAYIEVRSSDKTVFGIGIDSDVSTAGLKALLSAASGL
jgi:2-isopropylmalate synthase